MTKSVEAFKSSLLKIRTGRAHVGLLDQVMVDYYGTETAIQQVASVTLIDARTIGVQPWEKKMLASVEKAIRDAGLGLNPAAVGDSIRVPMPILTEERRRDLIKLVRAEAETARVSVRHARRDVNNRLKQDLKDKNITEDEERRAQDEVQKLTDRYVADIEELLQQKEKELMTV